ncbi:MAG: hypothetical protein HQK60_11910 [Deltaproteobacteria bacterium]|nr:hypothetical protein [Deltaproteobacteria bacterium]
MLESAAYEVIKEIEYQAGMVEGEAKGELKGMRSKSHQLMIDALKLRFHTLPASIAPSIEEINDMDILDNLFKSAITAVSLDQFIREMDSIIKP